VSNVVGKVVFTVIGAPADTATVQFSPRTEVYLNDGLGTKASVTAEDAMFGILPSPTLLENSWLTQVQADTIPPDAFAVQIESTRGVFGGRYYLVFSTVDKQSGLDHFEIFERGAWKRVTSPYQLKDQFLPDALQLRAIDKAGNERMGEYDKAGAPPRQFSWRDIMPLVTGVFLLFVAILGLALYMKRSRATTRDTMPPGYDAN
jgi:hypothetical protein